MSVGKIIELVGTSPSSFEDAVAQAVKEASKTVKGIHGIEVLGFTADVEGERITRFKANVKISFAVQR